MLTARLLESRRIFACVARRVLLGGWRRLHAARLLAKRQLEAAPRILHLLVLGPSLLCILFLLIVLMKIGRRGRSRGASLRPAVAADDQLARPSVAARVHEVLHCDVPLLILHSSMLFCLGLAGGSDGATQLVCTRTDRFVVVLSRKIQWAFDAIRAIGFFLHLAARFDPLTQKTTSASLLLNHQLLICDGVWLALHCLSWYTLALFLGYHARIGCGPYDPRLLPLRIILRVSLR